MKIYFLNGSKAGDSLDIKKCLYKIGRELDNDTVLDANGVSSYHALIQITSKGLWLLSDLKSTNGTKVNGELIDDSYYLTEGDVISLGDQDIRFGGKVNINKKKASVIPLKKQADDKASPDLTIKNQQIKIFFLNGSKAGNSLDLNENSFKIGRELDNDIILDTGGVSRYHAQIQITAEGLWLLSDLNSTNGTKVNGVLIDCPYYPKAGDVISLGDQDVRFGEKSDTNKKITSGILQKVQTDDKIPPVIKLKGR